MKNPAWLVRSRRLVKDFRFWLTLTGYDPNDPSITHKVYLVYAGLFWSLWLFAVLAWVAGSAAAFLGAATPDEMIRRLSGIGVFLVLAWLSVQVYQAARRSPAGFTENDRYLICQSPLERSSVITAWFWGEAPGQLLVVVVTAVLLGFIRIETILGGQVGWADFPMYFRSGLTSLAILVPFQLGSLAWAWSYGCLRLRRDKPISSRLFSIIPLLFWLFTILALLPETIFLSRVLIPVRFLVQSSLGLHSIWFSLIFSLAWMAAGWIALLRTSRAVNLGQAARETTDREMRSTLALLKDQRQASEILNRRRLPIERLPSRLPLREGFAALIWKSVAHLSRTFTFSSFLQWMTIAAAWAGIWVLGDPISKAFTALLWVMLVEDQISHSLQEDLYQWRIFGLLPLPVRSLVVGEIAASSLICILASCLGNGVVGFIAPSPLQGWVYGLIPGLVFCTACIGVYDISRRTQTGQLVAEQIQSVEMVGVLLGGVGMGITLYPAYWLITNGFPYGTVFLLTLIIQGLLAAIVLGIASQQYRQIRTRP